MGELKRCPFCGGEAGMFKPKSWGGSARVYCIECQSTTDVAGNEKEAIKAWNTRNPIDRIVERLEDLERDRIDTAYYSGDVFVDGQADGLAKAIETIKEEGEANESKRTSEPPAVS